MAIVSEHALGAYGKLVYYGNSPFFRKIKEGELTPEYNLTITGIIRLESEPEDSEILVKFEEILNQNP